MSDCNDIRDAIQRGESPEGAEVRAHLDGCAGCAELLADDGLLARRLDAAPAPELGELSDLLERVEGAVKEERGVVAWLRSRPSAVRVALALALAGGLVVLELFRKPRADLGVYPLDLMLIAVVLYAGLIGLAVSASLRPLQRPPLPERLRMALVWVALVLPFAVAAMPQAHVAHPAALLGVGGDFLARAGACFGYGMALAVPVVALLWALDRGGHRAWALVVLAAGVAGLDANLALQMHCPITHPEHLLMGHATVGVVLAVGYAGVRRLLARRSAQKSR